MLSVWSASQYWISALCSLTLLQLLCLVCGIPPPLSVGAVLWESVVVVPAVATTLALGPLDPAVMATATNKLYTRIHIKMCLFVMWCYGYKFLPFIIMVLATYVSLLGTFCQDIVSHNNGTRCFSLVYPSLAAGLPADVGGNYSSLEDMHPDLYSGMEWRGWGDVNGHGYMLAQQMAFLMTTILLLTISTCFVHRQHSLWRKSILLNKAWCICVIILLTVQVLFWSLTTLLPASEEQSPHFRYPVPHLVLICTSPLLVLALNELIKWQEIKANLRYQRRARLDFGTKLGMNSPF